MSELSNYFNEIEAAFNAGRGKFKMLSGVDFGLMQSWQTREIPLFVVLQAIADVTDKHRQRDRQSLINSLSYFEQAVEKAFAIYKDSQVGKTAPIISESVSRLTDKELAKLDELQERICNLQSSWLHNKSDKFHRFAELGIKIEIFKSLPEGEVDEFCAEIEAEIDNLEV
jgi:hypothetical protein